MKQTPPLRGTLLASAAVAGLTMAAAPASAEIPVEVLARPCAGCHGVDGSSMGPATPTIAGMSKDYFEWSMESYVDGHRPNTVMSRIAKGYTEEQVSRMADYFNAQPFQRIDQPFDKKLAERGAEIARTYCSDCHEQQGRESEGAGILAGQMLPYMEWSTTDFLSGDRDMERRQARAFRKLEAAEGREGFSAALNFYASQR